MQERNAYVITHTKCQIVIFSFFFSQQLPSSTTRKILRDQFRDAGDVVFAEMKTRDVGIVRFSSESEAKRAVCIL